MDEHIKAMWLLSVLPKDTMTSGGAGIKTQISLTGKRPHNHLSHDRPSISHFSLSSSGLKWELDPISANIRLETVYTIGKRNRDTDAGSHVHLGQFRVITDYINVWTLGGNWSIWGKPIQALREHSDTTQKTKAPTDIRKVIHKKLY